MTPSQIEQFDRLGYLLLPNQLPLSLLQLLREGTEQTIKTGHQYLATDTIPEDFRFHRKFITLYLNRIKNFHCHAPSPLLDALALPNIHEIATGLAGPEPLNSIDMLLVKNRDDDLPIPWHQDLIYDSQQYRVITVGIYLDDAPSGEGALKVLPGSHHKKHDLDTIEQDPQLSWHEIEAKAGDIVVHNAMAVHGSDVMGQQTRRRTLYYEFRPMALAKVQGWTEQALQCRQSLQDLSHKDQRLVSDIQACYRVKGPADMANFSRAFLARLG